MLSTNRKLKFVHRKDYFSKISKNFDKYRSENNLLDHSYDYVRNSSMISNAAYRVE